MDAAGNPPVWLLLTGVVAGLFLVIALLVVSCRWLARRLRWLSERCLAAAPTPLAEAARWLAAGVRVAYGMALLCGVTALGISVAIWRRDAFPDLDDPLFRSPLLWLTTSGLLGLA
jgi:hypothetical protein